MKLIVNCIHISTVQEIIYLPGGCSPVHSPFVFLFFLGWGVLLPVQNFADLNFIQVCKILYLEGGDM